jgi:hypothetical protein
MKRILVLSLWILGPGIINTYCQNFVLDERSVEKYYVYSDQMDYIVRSLNSGKISRQIKLDPGCTLSSEKFDSLSVLFKKYLPDSFFYQNVPYIDTKKIMSSTDFVRYSFAQVDNKDRMMIYMQLIVYFKSDSLVKSFHNARVLSIDIKNPKKMIPINKKNTLELYKERLARDARDSVPPPPPPPPAILYYKNN